MRNYILAIAMFSSGLMGSNITDTTAEMDDRKAVFKKFKYLPTHESIVSDCPYIFFEYASDGKIKIIRAYKKDNKNFILVTFSVDGNHEMKQFRSSLDVLVNLKKARIKTDELRHKYGDKIIPNHEKVSAELLPEQNTLIVVLPCGIELGCCPECGSSIMYYELRRSEFSCSIS